MKKTLPVSHKTSESVNHKAKSNGKTVTTTTTMFNKTTSTPDKLMGHNYEVITDYTAQNSHISTQNQPSISSQTIYGQIIEVDNHTVTLRCLIDEDERLFQKRSFDRMILEGAVNLTINQFVEMKISIGHGEVRFSFSNASKPDLKEQFAPKDYFSQFAGSSLFQPIPINIDADNF